ncbi:hypothetical protein SU67_25000, partial [Escherichia coli O139:H28 str. E24377A]
MRQKEEAKSSNSVFASNQLSTAGATRRIFAQVSRITAYASRQKWPNFVLVPSITESPTAIERLRLPR